MLIVSATRRRRDIKAWFPPMRLNYSHVYSYENKYNLIGANTLNNLKNKKKSYNFSWDHSFILIRIISKCFDTILTIFSKDYWDQRKTAEKSVTFDVNPLKMNKKQNSVINLTKKEWRRVTAEIWKFWYSLILASLKFESENTPKSTKSYLQEEELKAVVRRCSSN